MKYIVTEDEIQAYKKTYYDDANEALIIIKAIGQQLMTKQEKRCVYDGKNDSQRYSYCDECFLHKLGNEIIESTLDITYKEVLEKLCGKVQYFSK
jgi:hypothetical protein